MQKQEEKREKGIKKTQGPNSKVVDFKLKIPNRINIILKYSLQLEEM